MLKKLSGNSQKSVINIFWMLFDKVIKFGLGLLVTVLVANYYGANGYGTYQYAVSVVAVFELITFLVDSTVVKKFYVQYREEHVVIASTTARILFSLVAALFGAVYLFIQKSDIEYNSIFILLFVSSIVGSIQFGMTNRFEYLLKSKKIVIASDVAALIAFGLQLLAVYLKLPIIAIAVITLVSTSITMTITYFLYYRDFGRIFRGKIQKDLIKKIIVESFPFAVAAACITVYSKCDSIMIGAMISKADVGIYAIAIKIVSVVQIAIVPVTESVYPHLLKLNRENTSRYELYYTKISSMMTWLYIIGVGLSFVVLPFLFRFLSVEYIRAFDVYKVYVLGTFFSYNSALRSCHFAMTNNGRIVMISQIVSVFLNIGINYFLIRHIGMLGAAWATVVTQFVSLFLINLFFSEGRRILKLQIKALNPVYILKNNI